MKPLEMTKGRLATLAVGLPIFLAGIGYGGLTLTGVLARTSEHHQATYAWHGGPISVRMTDGSVTVHEDHGSVVTVSYTEHYQLQRAGVRATNTPESLALQATCGAVLAGSCSVNFDITVPVGAPLELNTGDGSVRLAGVSGTVKAHTGNGSVRASGLRSPAVQVSTGDGSVNLQWAGSPEHVTASTGNGQLAISLPPGSGPYAIDSHTGQGSSNIRVRSDPRASRTLLLHTGDGSLSVRYGG